MVSVELDPPPSVRRSHEPRARSHTLPLVAAALLVGLGGGFWLGRYTARPAVASARPTPAVNATAPAPAAPPAAASSAGVAAPAPAPAPALATAPSAGPRRLVVDVDGPLEDSVASALTPSDRSRAPELTAVVNRLLAWDLRIARDGRRGDRLEVLWDVQPPSGASAPEGGEAVVLALRYASTKLGGVLSAYRFEPKGARWARYYRADGREVELRLADAPIADYEQVTSLLRDGRRHKGVDFKTPVGSPVAAPFDGVVERRNWNFAGNGNCLDLRDPSTGRHAIFLHLDVLPREMAVGRKVRKGEVIASSGNSGHSFAPHLHYQLEDASGKVLDPFETLKTERRAVSAADRPAFDAARARLDAELGG